MTEYAPSPLEDALSLLEYESTTWVTFRSPIFLSYEGFKSRALGLWNFIFDVFVFWIEREGPELLIVAEGSIEESDWTTYRDEGLAAAFLRRYRELSKLESDILLADRKL